MTTQMDPATGKPKPAQQKQAEATVPQRKHSRIWMVVIALVGLAVVGFGAWRMYQNYQEKTAATAQNKGAAKNMSVPVVTAVVMRADVPVYLPSLGTVNAFNTVTVRTRIDGELTKVNFTEGDVVQKGQVLFEIDSRPYVAMLKQTQAQKVKDEAAQANAELDVKRYDLAGDAATQQQRDTALATLNQDKAAVVIDDSQIDAAQLNVTYCTITSPITGKIGLRLVDQGNMVHASDTTGLAVVTQLDPIALFFPIQQEFLPQVFTAINAGKVPVEAWNSDLTAKVADGELMTLDNEINVTTATVQLKSKFDNPKQKLGWLPNQFVNVKMLVDTLHGAVTVNSAALQRNGTTVFVYLVKRESATEPVAASAPAAEEPQSTSAGSGRGRRGGGGGGGTPKIVEKRSVTIGISYDREIVRDNETSQENDTVIASGLEPGDEVVTEGVDKLTDGGKVTTRVAGAEKGSATAPGASTEPSTRNSTRPGGRGGRRGATTEAAGEQQP